MAANGFATMLHRNTHKIALVLVYAVLEWILIILLLLNSFFSYLIVKFANYFGLKPPCLWCSRVDHVFEPGKKHTSYKDLVCERHASEISKLGYCSNHHKLAEAQDMCEDCSSSRPNSHGNLIDIEPSFTFFSGEKEMAKISSDGLKKIQNGEKDYRCSCCKGKLYSPYLLLQPSWGVLDYTQKANLITAAIGEDNDGGEYSDLWKSDCPTDHCKDEHEIKRNREEDKAEEEEDDDDDGIKEEHQIPSSVDECVQRNEEEAKEDYLGSPSSFQCEEMVENEEAEIDIVGITEQEPLKEDDSTISAAGMNVAPQDSDDTMIQFCCRDDASFEIIPLRLENFGDFDDDHRLVPIKLIDFTTAKNQNLSRCREEDRGKLDRREQMLDAELHIKAQFVSIVETGTVLEEAKEVLSVDGSENNTMAMKLESMEMGETKNSSILHAEECNGDLVGKTCEQVSITQATRFLANDWDDFEAGASATVKESDDPPASIEAGFKTLGDEVNSDILVVIAMSDQESIGQLQAHKLFPSFPCLREDQSSRDYDDARYSNNFDALMADSDQGAKQAEEEIMECRTISFDKTEHGINHHLSACSEINEVDQEKGPETPPCVDGLRHQHKKLVPLEKRESGAVESLDGSVICEFESEDGVLTVEHLKSALQAERKALSALYAELEEERSASAIAAKQTMAMITRLQEEKAAMQMEALQYQRMMEEQSEYDQEALQLLNELMVKREKEKQELEKELEIYCQKLLDYEMKEKRMMRRRKDSNGRSQASSASSSNTEDSDEVSLDHNHKSRDEDGFNSLPERNKNFTPANAALNLDDMGLECAKHLSTLDESLAEFEEERLSILEQLKALEEKLFTLDDDEERFFEDIKPIEHFPEQNGKELTENSDFSSQEVNGVANGFSEDLGVKHCQERRSMGDQAKKLLPLFDAIGIENENEVLSEEQRGSSSVFLHNSSVSKFALENKKLAIEEEVDHVYERLQALEADREFLKHCIGSLKKGDKGMDLLQEILEHLRDLRSVELRVRNMSNGALPWISSFLSPTRR